MIIYKIKQICLLKTEVPLEVRWLLDKFGATMRRHEGRPWQSKRVFQKYQ
jgi:hypothetical protein